MKYHLSLITLIISLLLATPVLAKTAAEPVAAPAAPQHDKTVLPPKIAPDKLPKKVKLEGSAYIPFPTYDRGKKIMGGGFLLLPPNLIVGKHKVPVMLIMHGSRGVTPEHEYVYARELVKMGVAAFVIDSYTPRGVATTHENQRLISIRDFILDAYRGLYKLRSEPRVDITRAGVVGFSKGGIVALQAAMHVRRQDMRIHPELKFKAHYAFYPGCVTHYYNNLTTGAPITFFLGAKDTYTGVTPCINLSNELKATGAKIQTIIYEDAVHGWDFPGEEAYPQAEVFKDCDFYQQADNTWIEKKSGVKGIKGLEGPMYEKALKGCLTYGVVSTENPVANAKSMADFKRLVKEQLIDAK